MPRSPYSPRRSPRRSRSPSYLDDCANIFCGNMNPTSNKYDLEKLFTKYGKIVDIWVARKPPGFGFVYMDDPRDARDAVKGLNGVTLHGSRLRIEISETNKNKLGPRGGYKERKEISRSERRSPSYGRDKERDRDRGRRGKDYSDDDYRSRSRSHSYGKDRDRRGRDRGRDRDSYRDRDRGSYRRRYSRSRSRSRSKSRGRGRDSYSDKGYSAMAMMRGGPDRYSQKKGPRRTDFRVNLAGLAEGTSWQDLKSLFRKYAEPGYVQIYTKGEGIVEFNSLDEMEHVIRKLHDTKFRGSMVQLTEDAKCKAKREDEESSKDGRDEKRNTDNRDKDRIPHRSRSRSRSRNRRSYSGSPSPSPARGGRKRGRSPSRSRSRSKGRSRSRSPPKRSRRERSYSRSYSRSRSRSRRRDKKRGSRKEKREHKSKKDHEEDDLDENNDGHDEKREKKKEQNGAANGHGKGKDDENGDNESDDGEERYLT